MKRRILITFGITAGVLVLLFIILVPAAPLLTRFGLKPFCIQGDFPKFKIVPCTQFEDSSPVVTPLPLPTLNRQAPTPLIFDDDGSPDGMIALLFFLRNPLYRVEAVTISPGEAHPEIFARHAARLLAAMGRPDIPVGYGRATPLQGSNAFPEPWRQSSDAFWNVSLAQAAASIAPVPAASLIVDTLNRSPHPMAVFISGTHTNLAEALRLDPGIAGHISAVYIMGGSIYLPGNIESAWPEIHNRVAEWNIWVDPLAASEVFASGMNLHLMPLDGTSHITWHQADAQIWSTSGTPEAVLAAKILSWMLQSYPIEEAYIWDLAAAAATTDSRLCREIPLALDIIVDAGAEQGRTIVTDQNANTLVCLEPDAAQVKARVEDILTK